MARGADRLPLGRWRTRCAAATPRRRPTPDTLGTPRGSRSGHPEKLTDFARRSVHEMTLAAKAPRHRVLRTRRKLLALEWLFGRRTPGDERSADVPGRLRRHRRRLAGTGLVWTIGAGRARRACASQRGRAAAAAGAAAVARRRRPRLRRERRTQGRTHGDPRAAVFDPARLMCMAAGEIGCRRRRKSRAPRAVLRHRRGPQVQPPDAGSSHREASGCPPTRMDGIRERRRARIASASSVWSSPIGPWAVRSGGRTRSAWTRGGGDSAALQRLGSELPAVLGGGGGGRGGSFGEGSSWKGGGGGGGGGLVGGAGVEEGALPRLERSADFAVRERGLLPAGARTVRHWGQ